MLHSAHSYSPLAFSDDAAEQILVRGAGHRSARNAVYAEDTPVAFVADVPSRIQVVSVTEDAPAALVAERTAPPVGVAENALVASALEDSDDIYLGSKVLEDIRNDLGQEPSQNLRLVEGSLAAEDVPAVLNVNEPDPTPDGPLPSPDFPECRPSHPIELHPPDSLQPRNSEDASYAIQPSSHASNARINRQNQTNVATAVRTAGDQYRYTTLPGVVLTYADGTTSCSPAPVASSHPNVTTAPIAKVTKSTGASSATAVDPADVSDVVLVEEPGEIVDGEAAVKASFSDSEASNRHSRITASDSSRNTEETLKVDEEPIATKVTDRPSTSAPRVKLNLDTPVQRKKKVKKFLGCIVTSVDDKVRTLNGVSDKSRASGVHEPRELTLRILYHRHERWYERRDWLHEAGYALPDRYLHAWEIPPEGVFLEDDDVALSWDSVAIQIARKTCDNGLVVLKSYNLNQEPLDHSVLIHANAAPQRDHPDNHCVKLFDVVENPNDERNVVVVMPFLRRWNDPMPDTVGEAINMFAQVMEGIRWLHKLGIAWRTKRCNLDRDILYGPEHLFKYGRPYPASHKHAKYYLADFMQSQRYHPPRQEVAETLADVLDSDGKIIKEKQELIDKNKTAMVWAPFAHDLYNIAQWFRENFYTPFEAFHVEPFTDLLASMQDDAPEKSITINQAIERLYEIRCTFSASKLRGRLRHPVETFPEKLASVPHAFRTMSRIVAGHPPVRDTWIDKKLREGEDISFLVEPMREQQAPGTNLRKAVTNAIASMWRDMHPFLPQPEEEEKTQEGTQEEISQESQEEGLETNTTEEKLKKQKRMYRKIWYRPKCWSTSEDELELNAEEVEVEVDC